MQPVLTVSEMNAVDAAALASTPLETLVARAGLAVARAALELLGGAYGRRVTVVAGPGNNGADGRVAAEILRRRGARTRLVDVASPTTIGPADLVIDAAFGTGFRGEFRFPPVPDGTPVLAVDIPSGVHGDTGEASGAPATAVRTVTFVALKPGLLQGDGVRLAGEVAVADIGLPAGSPPVTVIEDGDLARLVPMRSRQGNKWSAAVLVVAGSPGMAGAAGLCARAAYRAGAGMVRLGVPGLDLADSPAAEAVSVPLPAEGWASAALDAASRCTAVVVGPGLGRAESTAADVLRLLADSPVPVVVDADGLYALGQVGRDRSLQARSRLVLTPHDGEFARLAGRDPGPDRIAAARALASTLRRGGPPQRAHHRRGSPRQPGPPGPGGHHRPGHRGDRGRPVRDHRGPLGTRCRPPRRCGPGCSPPWSGRRPGLRCGDHGRRPTRSGAGGDGRARNPRSRADGPGLRHRRRPGGGRRPRSRG